MAEIHEYVVFSFKEGIDRDEQVATMRELDPLLALVTGFVSREYFCSEADGRWVDHVVWANLADAVASERIMEDPVAAPLFARFEPASVVFGRYERVV